MMRTVIAVLLSIWLSGCASSRVAAVRPPQVELASFTLDGRIAIKHEGERSSAGLHWVHRAENDDMLLLGPLGVTVAHLQRDRQGVSLDASGQHYDARDNRELMQHVLGWHLPLEGLQYWVLAQPVPGLAADVERDAGGRLSQLSQDGWVIQYAQYQGAAADSLPLRIALRREGLEVLLLINEWAMP